LVGGTIPGLPFVVIGKSKYIQWGMTASHSDVADLYRERISDDGLHYFLDG
jgi:penicillin amidase